MAALITSITPGRGRDGDTLIEIAGTGFDGASNTVTVDGQAATVTFNSTTLVRFTVPGGITLEQYVSVVLTNTVDTIFDNRLWYSQDSIVSQETVRLTGQIPGEDEIASGLGNEEPLIPQAKDYERIVTLLEFVRDIALSAPTSEQQTVTTTATLTLTENHTTVFIDSSGGAFVITIPSTHPAGDTLTFKKITAANGISIITADADTIDGHDAYRIYAGSLGEVKLESDGTNWHVMGKY